MGSEWSVPTGEHGRPGAGHVVNDVAEPLVRSHENVSRLADMQTSKSELGRPKIGSLRSNPPLEILLEEPSSKASSFAHTTYERRFLPKP